MVFGSNLQSPQPDQYNPEALDQAFRFTETNFDYSQLSPRDWSLIEVAGIPLGAVYKVSSLEKQLSEANRLIELLAIENKSLSNHYGKTPWQGGRA
jgi:hypothetical protein